IESTRTPHSTPRTTQENDPKGTSPVSCWRTRSLMVSKARSASVPTSGSSSKPGMGLERFVTTATICVPGTTCRSVSTTRRVSSPARSRYEWLRLLMGDLPSPTDKGLHQGLNLAVRARLCDLLPVKDYYTGHLRSKPQYFHHFSSFFNGIRLNRGDGFGAATQNMAQREAHAVHRRRGCLEDPKDHDGRLAVAETPELVEA